MTDRTVWYAQGLRFTCQRCGGCCGGAPGYVWVDETEIAAIARFLRQDPDRFRATTTRVVARRGVSLNERPGGDCVFFQRGQGCTIYAVRPRQCRTWPFWRSNVDTSDDWTSCGFACPGVGRGGLHDLAEISQALAKDGLPG